MDVDVEAQDEQYDVKRSERASTSSSWTRLALRDYGLATVCKQTGRRNLWKAIVDDRASIEPA